MSTQRTNWRDSTSTASFTTTHAPASTIQRARLIMSANRLKPPLRGMPSISTSQSAPGIYKSAIMQHAADSQHHFRSEDIKVLSRESGWHERGIRESIFIRALSPSLNRNEGRHALPHCYDPLIRKAIKKPERPKTHDPTEPRLNTEKRGPGRPRIISATTSEETNPKSLLQPRHPMTTRSRGTAANRDGPSPGQSD